MGGLRPKPPKEAASEEHVTALQARLEALRSARLLSDGERDTIADTLADYLELKAARGRVTFEYAHASEGAASRLLKLAGLSEGIAADGAFREAGAPQVATTFIYAAEQISLCSTNHSQHVPPVRHALSSSVKIRPQTALFG